MLGINFNSVALASSRESVTNTQTPHQNFQWAYVIFCVLSWASSRRRAPGLRHIGVYTWTSRIWLKETYKQSREECDAALPAIPNCGISRSVYVSICNLSKKAGIYNAYPSLFQDNRSCSLVASILTLFILRAETHLKPPTHLFITCSPSLALFRLP